MILLISFKVSSWDKHSTLEDRWTDCFLNNQMFAITQSVYSIVDFGKTPVATLTIIHWEWIMIDEKIQHDLVHSIIGLEDVTIERPGYAIENPQILLLINLLKVLKNLKAYLIGELRFLIEEKQYMKQF